MRSSAAERLLLFLGRGALFTFAVVCFCLAFSEALFYSSNGIFYFLRKNAGSTSADMSLYREPFSIDKKKGRKRIVTIGGSTTYGFGVDPKDTWPKKLSSFLERDFPGRYEVVNLGRVGSHLEEFKYDYERSLNIYIPRDAWMGGSRPEVSGLASWGWKDLEPDILIVAPVVNDTAPDYLYLSEANLISRAVAGMNRVMDDSFIINRLAFGFYFKKALSVIEYKNRTFVADDSRRLDMIRSSYKTNLRGFLKLWEGRPRVILLGLPLFFNRTDGEKQALKAAAYWNLADTDSISREVKYLPLLEGLESDIRAEVSNELGIEHREVGVEIKGMDLGDRLRLYDDPVHMNKKGTRLVAEEIYRSFFPADESL